MCVQAENMGSLNCVDVHVLFSATVGDCLVLCPTEQGTTVSFVGQNREKEKQRPSPFSASLTVKHRSTAFAPSHHCVQRERVMYSLYLGGE